MFPLHNSTSVYNSELYDILQCLLHCKQLKLKSPVIFTDSMSATASIKTHLQNDELSLAIRNELFEFRSTVLVWIPSHMGIHGNDLADAAARDAATLHSPPLPVSLHADRCRAYKASLNERWQHIWSNECSSQKLYTVKANYYSMGEPYKNGTARGDHINKSKNWSLQPYSCTPNAQGTDPQLPPLQFTPYNRTYHSPLQALSKYPK